MVANEQIELPYHGDDVPNVVDDARSVIKTLPHDVRHARLLGIDQHRPQRFPSVVHLTASVVLFDLELRRVLLLRRSGGRLIQPGGHAEAADDTLLAAAARELGEETGITVATFLPDPIDVDLHSVEEPELVGHLDFRFVASTGYEGPLSGDEVENARWVLVEAALADRHVGPLVAKARLAASTLLYSVHGDRK